MNKLLIAMSFAFAITMTSAFAHDLQSGHCYTFGVKSYRNSANGATVTYYMTVGDSSYEVAATKVGFENCRNFEKTTYGEYCEFLKEDHNEVCDLR